MTHSAGRKGSGVESQVTRYPFDIRATLEYTCGPLRCIPIAAEQCNAVALPLWGWVSGRGGGDAWLSVMAASYRSNDFASMSSEHFFDEKGSWKHWMYIVVFLTRVLCTKNINNQAFFLPKCFFDKQSRLNVSLGCSTNSPRRNFDVQEGSYPLQFSIREYEAVTCVIFWFFPQN